MIIFIWLVRARGRKGENEENVEEKESFKKKKKRKKKKKTPREESSFGTVDGSPWARENTQVPQAAEGRVKDTSSEGRTHGVCREKKKKKKTKRGRTPGHPY